jgi:hypothetical protein
MVKTNACHDGRPDSWAQRSSDRRFRCPRGRRRKGGEEGDSTAPPAFADRDAALNGSSASNLILGRQGARPPLAILNRILALKQQRPSAQQAQP